MSPKHNWFNEKYKDGEKPSLVDKLNLFREVFSEEDIKIPDRTKNKLKELLKKTLYDLKRDYSESSHVIAHSILFCCSPLLNLEKNEYKEYINLYSSLMEKYESKTSFNHNFKP